jgi:hypothetical protein
MTKADHAVERGAVRLQKLSEKAAARGDGVGEWLAEELANDAAFLRKLKPSLIKARAKGRAPIARAEDRQPEAPSAPQIAAPRRKPKAKKRRRSGGPNPFLVAGVALAAGIAIAKVIDWRGHAHPRD